MAKQYGIQILSDEEFDKRERLRQREALLARLDEVSMKKKKSVVRPKKEEKPIRQFGDPVEMPDFHLNDPENRSVLSDATWDQFTDQMEIDKIDQMDLSPMENATAENIMGFWDDDEDENYFDNLFKDEIAMASEVLKELNAMGKLVNSKIKAMSGKGAGGGAPKSYADLIQAGTSLQTAKISAIDKIAGWKQKREDLKMKAKKDEPVDVEQDTNAMVDQYYSRVLSGNQKEYTQMMMSQVAPASAPIQRYGNDDNDSADSYYGDTGGFNITDHMREDIEYTDGRDFDTDPYGYIRNEGKDVEICIQRFPSGNMSFIALDADGESVDDYELPDPSFLQTLSIRPTSKYANDETGRRYRIVDFDPNEDISDI